MNSLMNQMSNVKASPYQMMKMSEHLAGRAHGQIDLGYVKTLLYPELYNADIP